MLISMGLIGRLEWVSSYSQKQCRSLFGKLRAAVKKAVKNGEKKQFNFQYDPSSYALNFDDTIWDDVDVESNQRRSIRIAVILPFGFMFCE